MHNIPLLHIIISSLIVVITCLCIKLNDPDLYKRKKNVFSLFAAPLIVSLFIIGLICYPKECYNAAVDGVRTWGGVVLPALLPFLIGAELLIGLGVTDFLGSMIEPVIRPVFKTPGLSAFVFIMSIISGYPVGVKLTCALRQKGKCTRAEGQRMLAFCSTSGPLFMIGAVAVGMLGSPSAGTIIAVSHYISSILLGIISGAFSKDKSNRQVRINNTGSIRAAINAMLSKKKTEKRPFGVLWGDAVRESINTLLTIGGFIVTFAVIIQLFRITRLLFLIADPIKKLLSNTSFPHALIEPVLSGMLEITTGSMLISDIKTLPLIHAVPAISLIIGWSGFSVHAQALSFISSTDLSPTLYLCSKLLHGILCCIMSYVLCLLFLSGKCRHVFLPTPDILPHCTFLHGLFLSAAGFFVALSIIITVIVLYTTLQSIEIFHPKKRN